MSTKPTAMQVHADISDLFFNLERGDVMDETALREQATWFVGCIERIAYVYAPSVDQLLEDFYGRA